MSGNYFAVDTEALAHASPEVLRLAQRLKPVTSGLESRTSRLGDCWGRDGGGRQFAKRYVTPKAEFLAGLSKAVLVLDGIGDGVQTMAKGYQKAEEEAVDAVSDFKKENPERYVAATPLVEDLSTLQDPPRLGARSGKRIHSSLDISR
jgi:uncharacterized protein YukE